FGVPAFIVRPDGWLKPETREIFTSALTGLRAAGATVVINDEILPQSFAALTNAVKSGVFRREGLEDFLSGFGPHEYHSIDDYNRVVGSRHPSSDAPQRTLKTDPEAETLFWAPQRQAIAAYDAALDRFHLDGFVYPALQMPSKDETLPNADLS